MGFVNTRFTRRRKYGRCTTATVAPPGRGLQGGRSAAPASERGDACEHEAPLADPERRGGGEVDDAVERRRERPDRDRMGDAEHRRDDTRRRRGERGRGPE